MNFKAIFHPSFGWVPAMGGGVFTGKAADASAPEVGEDLSDMVEVLANAETPLLDELGDSGIEATNQLHEWLRDQLNPTVLTLGANVASSAATGFAVAVADSGHLKAGQILESENDGKANHEHMLITSIFGANTIIVDRAVAGTSATSHTSNNAVAILGSAQLEGDDPSRDISSDRERITNLTQIFEARVQISGTKSAVNNVGVPSEIDHQVAQRLSELLRQYEKSIIRGRKLVNTVQSTGRRTLAGMVGSVTQTQSLGTFVSSGLDDLLQKVWDQGGNPDLVLLNAALKRTANLFQGSAVRANQADRVFVRQTDVYEGFKGQQMLMLNRWMDPNKVLAGEKKRVRTVPMRGRSFFADTLGKTGDRRDIQLIGEYTMELGHANAWSLGTNVLPQ